MKQTTTKENEVQENIEQLETQMAEIGETLLAARMAALSPEFIEKQERKLAEAWESSRYDHLDLDTIDRRLESARSLKREKQAAYETTLVVDVKIAQLEAAQAKQLARA